LDKSDIIYVYSSFRVLCMRARVQSFRR